MTELTTGERIKTHLLFHGITENVIIDKEAEDHILLLLESDALEKVSIDEDGSLLIEFKE